MKAEDLIKNNSLTDIEVTGGHTVVFTDIALTAINMAREEGANNFIQQASANGEGMSKKESLVKWKTVETFTPSFPDGVIFIKEDTPVEFPLAMVVFPIGRPELGIERQRKRAKLIAAAPELLEALQEMLERFDNNDQSIYSFADKEIKAAIKKALE